MTVPSRLQEFFSLSSFPMTAGAGVASLFSSFADSKIRKIKKYFWESLCFFQDKTLGNFSITNNSLIDWTYWKC